MQIEAAHIVGGSGAEAGIVIEAVLAGELIAFTEHGAGIGAGRQLRGIANADIGAGAGLDAVVSGELVDVEQDGVVEDEALRIFVRDLRLIDADRVRPADDLGDRLEDMGDAAGRADERIAILRAADGGAAHQRAAQLKIGRRIGEFVHAVKVAAKLGEGRVDLADAVDHLPPPRRLHDEAVRIGAVSVGEGHDVRVEAKLAADDRVLEDVVVVDDRVDRRVGKWILSAEQRAGLVEAHARIVPVVQALEVDLRDAVGLQLAVEVVEAAEGVVALGDGVPSPGPIGIERKLALRDDAAAEVVVDVRAIRRCRR